MRDEILEELWKIKDQIASETKEDTQAFFERLRAVELEPSHRLVNRTSSRKKQHS
ncbi:MAG: hypothetical protein QGH15_16625 [Kiritimatiellia bacterium]|jgi:hypothetical protein|nr:hypothetical protein [Kiritimatiellia bacterium]